MSSLENVPLGPSVHPVEVVISWMGPRLVDSHHLRMVSSEHSTGSLMTPSVLGSRCLKMVVLSWRSQALITARMMVCQKMYTYQRRDFMGLVQQRMTQLFSSSRLQLGKRTGLAVPT
ncbi:hypothetical protein F7725_017553 [Dissostichus mawsoni]|uniref:Uncharacterized protein n=1 Tax=Dissostichus mawsoni TaxID=36200 RepID=A0A7J5Z5F6_DISMA|nr:hypothetical protein F7725_017553 [Dissostichus mawsoni]